MRRAADGDPIVRNGDCAAVSGLYVGHVEAAGTSAGGTHAILWVERNGNQFAATATLAGRGPSCSPVLVW